MLESMYAIVAGTALALAGEGRLQAINVKETLSLQHAESLTAATLSPDGKYVVSAMCDEEGEGTLTFWNTDSGKRVATIQTRQIMIMSLAIRGDGKILASGARDGSLCLWDIEKKSLISKSVDKLGMAYPLAFLPGMNTLVSQDIGGCPIMWDTKNPSRVKRFVDQPFKFEDSYSSYGITKDGKKLAMGEGSLRDVNDMAVFDVASGRKEKTLKGSANIASKIAFSGDGLFLAAGFTYGNRRKNTVKLWELSTGKEFFPFTHDSGVCSLDISTDGSIIAAGNNFGKITFWNITTKKMISVDAHEGQVFWLAFSSDGKRLWSAGADSKLSLWEMK